MSLEQIVGVGWSPHTPTLNELIIIAVLIGLLIVVVLWELLGRKKKQPEHLPWYRQRNYKGNLTEVEKRQLDFFRMQEKHPAADFDGLPEEVKRYVGGLELEVYDNKQGAIALQTLFVSGVGGYFLIRYILGYDEGSLFGYVWSSSLLILPWFWYRIKWNQNAEEFLPSSGPSSTHEAILKEWELDYIFNKRKADEYEKEESERNEGPRSATTK